MDSDVDFVVITSAPSRYATTEDWMIELTGEAAPIIRTQQYGPVIERRVLVASGLEIEFGFAPPHWAATGPVDSGTARVVSDGLGVIYDPQNLLRNLREAASGSGGHLQQRDGER